MMNKTLLLTLLILLNISSFAQVTITDPVLESKLFVPFGNYFAKDLEWIYTHFNKSAYLQGDDIWFTSYVLNAETKLLDFNTSKLYVELWSPEKKLISRKILYVKAGTTNNYIHLTDSLAPGNYCFRAYTTWMRNFYQKNDFNTIIPILGPNKTNSNKPIEKPQKASRGPSEQEGQAPEPTTPFDYDIRFFPESGHFLADATNVLGIKATDSTGKGIKISGEIVIQNSQKIISFSTNNFGMGDLILPNATSQAYIAKVMLPNGISRYIQLPQTELQGVIIHVNIYQPGEVWFKITTNKTTRQLNKSYTLMIHANGKMYNTFRLNFAKGTSLQFSVKNKELGHGILYATLFDENLTPIAERVFYNPVTVARGKLAFNAKHIINDTVELKVNTADSLIKTKLTKLSISVLPEKTVLNHFDKNLLVESILRPVLKGNIENPNWYFEKKDIEHLVAMNDLLLTQGWRKYDWPTILKDTVHNFAYPFEEKFAIEGKVEGKVINRVKKGHGIKNNITSQSPQKTKSKITLLSPQNKISLLTSTDSLGEFYFDRVHLTDSTWTVATALSDKGKKWNTVLQMSIPEFKMEAPDIKPIPLDKNMETVGNIPILPKGAILLHEIVIKGTKKNRFADNIYVGFTNRTLEITKDNYRLYTNMELLLRYFNVKIIHSQENLSEYHFQIGRAKGETTFKRISSTAEDPLMMIDGIKVHDPVDILNFPINLVEAVAVNIDGSGAGLEGATGVIAIKTRKTPLIIDDHSERANIKRLLVNGYASPKEYFEPKYLIQPGSYDYDRFAAIYWKPDLVIDSTGIASFRFAVPKEIKSVTIRAEGLSLEGIPFLHEQKLTLPGRD